MSELTTRGHAAIAALQGDTASDAECARVRARLSALGVAVVASGASASLASSVAASAAAPGVAPAAIANVGVVGTAPAALSAGTAGGTSVSLAPVAGALLTKLAGVPAALKASAVLALVAGVGAVALPASRTEPTLRSAPAHVGPVAQPPHARAPRVELKSPAANVASLAPKQAPEVSGPTGAEAAVVPGRAPARAARSASGEPAGTRAPQSGAARTARAAAEAPSSSTLAAEGALLATALRALRAGQRAHAQDLLDQHERVFGPHALLARERERMREELSQTLR